MSKENLKEELPRKGCQKCGHAIGGKSYYIVSLDCLYDGESISACETYVLCSHCNNEIRHWLNLKSIQE